MALGDQQPVEGIPESNSFRSSLRMAAARADSLDVSPAMHHRKIFVSSKVMERWRLAGPRSVRCIVKNRGRRDAQCHLL
jgi:hypothetical protein